MRVAVTCPTEKRENAFCNYARYFHLFLLLSKLKSSELTLTSALLTTAFAASCKSAYSTRYNAKVPSNERSRLALDRHHTPSKANRVICAIDHARGA